MTAQRRMNQLYMWSVQVEKKQRASHLKKPLILFFKSIVHDLVYEAAILAIDKTKDVSAEEEMLHPTVTVLGKSNATKSTYAHRRGTKAKKKSSKSAKANRKHTKTEDETEMDIENDENAGKAVVISKRISNRSSMVYLEVQVL